MTSKTELRQLSSEALFSRLLSSDSEDYVIKDILRTRLAAGMRVTFADGSEFRPSNTRVPYTPEEVEHKPGVTELARNCAMMISSGWQGEGLKYKPEEAMAWIHLAVEDNVAYEDLIPEAQRFHTAAFAKWKLWMKMKQLENRS